MDLRSATRWNVSASMQCEERLNQGVHVLSRGSCLVWIDEDFTAAQQREVEEWREQAEARRVERACMDAERQRRNREAEKARTLAARKKQAELHASLRGTRRTPTSTAGHSALHRRRPVDRIAKQRQKEREARERLLKRQAERSSRPAWKNAF